MNPTVAVGLGSFCASLLFTLRLAAMTPTHAVLSRRTRTSLHTASLAAAMANASATGHHMMLTSCFRTAQTAAMSDTKATGFRSLTTARHCAELGITDLGGSSQRSGHRSRKERLKVNEVDTSGSSFWTESDLADSGTQRRKRLESSMSILVLLSFSNSVEYVTHADRA